MISIAALARLWSQGCHHCSWPGLGPKHALASWPRLEQCWSKNKWWGHASSWGRDFEGGMEVGEVGAVSQGCWGENCQQKRYTVRWSAGSSCGSGLWPHGSQLESRLQQLLVHPPFFPPQLLNSQFQDEGLFLGKTSSWNWVSTVLYSVLFK